MQTAGLAAATRGRAARPARLWLLLLLVAGLSGLAGCGRSVPDRLAQVRQTMAKKDRPAALLQVKSLLQAHPNQPEGRELLGTLLLETGDPLAAEIELRRALELNRPESAVLPVLARALLASNQAGKLVMQFGKVQLPPGRGAAQFRAAVAEAEATLGDLEAARTSLAQALRDDNDYEPARLMQARITAVAGDLPGALLQVDTVLARLPDYPDAWVLKGDLQARLNDDRAAVRQAYERALAARPDHANAHAALVALHLEQRDAAAAREQLAAMRKLLPRHPQTLLFDGQMAMLDNDLPRARERFQDLLRVLPEHPGVLQSAGAVELRLGAPVQAEVLLSKAVALVPDSLSARRLLAQSYLALGQPDRALATLDPLLALERADAEALTLAAQAELLSDRPAAAAALYDRAARLKPEDPKVRTAVALSRLARGQTELALNELRAVASQDSGTVADMALIAAQLRRKDLAAALTAIDRLQRKQPDQPLALHLRGQVLLQRQDLAGARQAFDQALALDAGYFPTVAALAGLELMQGQADAAQARLESLIRLRPRVAPAYLALAELASRSGAGRDQVTARLESGIKANPADASLRLALVDHHLATLNPKAGLHAAQAALALWPQRPDLLERLGRAQLAVGEHQQAQTTYNSLAMQQPRSPAGYIGLAEAQLAGNDLGAAQRSSRRALALAPDHLPAQRLAITVALRLNKPDEALAVARRLQQQQPERALGWLLEGEIHLLRQQWPAAVASLRQALTRQEPAQTPARLHHALRQAGQAAEAQAMAEAWLKAHPRDTLFLFYLGDQAMAQRDLAGAEARYRAVLQISPEHALSLNNIAWLLLQQQQAGALPLAERAVRAMPDQPALLDTLALAYARDDQAEQAVVTQRRALQIQPDDPSLRLNLARHLMQAGDKRQAKAELDRLAQLGDRFSRQDEVAALRQRLGGR